MAATRDQGPEPGAGSQSSDGNVASPGPASLALHAVAVPAVYWILDRAVRAAATRSPDLFPRNSVLDVMIGSPRAALLSVAFGTGAAAYVALHRGLQASLARFAFYKQMNPEERARMEGWSLSFVNAVLMSVLGFKALYYPNDTQDSISIALLASYLLADLPILIPYYKARFLDIAHHFATLGLCYEILYRSVLPSHKAFIMLTELSTVFLDLARILPVVGLGKSPAFLASGVAFAVSFIGVRVVWYGIRLVRADYLGVDPDWKALGRLGKWIARGLFGLQVWWVGEIAEKAIEIFGKKK